MEVLIVIALISMLILGGIALIDPKKQIERAWDAKRKVDIRALQKIAEDYFNDKDAYPDSVFCDDDATIGMGGESCSCHICNIKKSGIEKYTSVSYCDPRSPARSYLYLYDCKNERPTWYQICASLSRPLDEVVNPYNDVYNYGVASSQRQFTFCVVDCPNDATAGKYCWKTVNDVSSCNNCGTFNLCLQNQACDYPYKLFDQPGCDPRRQCQVPS